MINNLGEYFYIYFSAASFREKFEQNLKEEPNDLFK